MDEEEDQAPLPRPRRWTSLQLQHSLHPHLRRQRYLTNTGNSPASAQSSRQPMLGLNQGNGLIYHQVISTRDVQLNHAWRSEWQLQKIAESDEAYMAKKEDLAIATMEAERIEVRENSKKHVSEIASMQRFLTKGNRGPPIMPATRKRKSIPDDSVPIDLTSSRPPASTANVSSESDPPRAAKRRRQLPRAQIPRSSASLSSPERPHRRPSRVSTRLALTSSRPAFPRTQDSLPSTAPVPHNPAVVPCIYGHDTRDAISRTSSPDRPSCSVQFPSPPTAAQPRRHGCSGLSSTSWPSSAPLDFGHPLSDPMSPIDLPPIIAPRSPSPLTSPPSSVSFPTLSQLQRIAKSHPLSLGSTDVIPATDYKESARRASPPPSSGLKPDISVSENVLSRSHLEKFFSSPPHLPVEDRDALHSTALWNAALQSSPRPPPRSSVSLPWPSPHFSLDETRFLHSRLNGQPSSGSPTIPSSKMPTTRDIHEGTGSRVSSAISSSCHVMARMPHPPITDLSPGHYTRHTPPEPLASPILPSSISLPTSPIPLMTSLPPLPPLDTNHRSHAESIGPMVARYLALYPYRAKSCGSIGSLQVGDDEALCRDTLELPPPTFGTPPSCPPESFFNSPVRPRSPDVQLDGCSANTTQDPLPSLPLQQGNPAVSDPVIPPSLLSQLLATPSQFSRDPGSNDDDRKSPDRAPLPAEQEPDYLPSSDDGLFTIIA